MAQKSSKFQKENAQFFSHYNFASTIIMSRRYKVYIATAPLLLLKRLYISKYLIIYKVNLPYIPLKDFAYGISTLFKLYH